MHRTLAGHLPLQDMIARTLENAQTKLASASAPVASQRAAPAAKEKVASGGLDASDPQHIEKLASALEALGNDFTKEADSIENGGESSQGGMQLPTNNGVAGRQGYKKDGSKKHQVPMSTGLQSSSDGGGSTQVPNDAARAPGGAPYPAKGVFKTAASAGVLERIQARRAELAGEAPAAQEAPEAVQEKTSGAVNFILNKIAESAQGGMTLDTPSGVGPKPSSDAKGGNDARKAIESNSAATNMKKVDGKVPQKRMLSEVLTEPALTSSTDSKVQENLRNASKGGVKIAAAKAFLQKIAADPTDPRHEKLKASLEKKRAEKQDKEKESGMGMTSPMMSSSGFTAGM